MIRQMVQHIILVALAFYAINAYGGKNNEVRKWGRKGNKIAIDLTKPIEKTLDRTITQPVARHFENNKKLYGNAGRAWACVYTTCYSEIQRDKEIKEEKKKLAKEMEEFKASKLEAERRNDRKTTEDIRQGQIQNLMNSIELNETTVKDYTEKRQALIIINNLISQEIELRDQEKISGQLRARETAVATIAKKFDLSLRSSRAVMEASPEFEEELNRFAQQFQSNFETVYSAAIGWLGDQSLEKILASNSHRILTIDETLNLALTKIAEDKAQLDVFQRDSEEYQKSVTQPSIRAFTTIPRGQQNILLMEIK